ncbi:putative oxidoreductase [Secundilactobacillus oryzae JCM 18671]|uniref:Putative oxidoreductase n=1 Tax=Secundilactobacillus oryzae JCM 18671 TaxID=1291743 RepID=A0A081BIG9_9LACO|nr:putative oxidoreductase [Secundilactobacillus oryzae JCM 18671]
MSKDLEGKVAIITGAASGMGKAMAELFTAEGAKVVAADLNEARLEELKSEFSAKGA